MNSFLLGIKLSLQLAALQAYRKTFLMSKELLLQRLPLFRINTEFYLRNSEFTIFISLFAVFSPYSCLFDYIPCNFQLECYSQSILLHVILSTRIPCFKDNNCTLSKIHLTRICLNFFFTKQIFYPVYFPIYNYY